MPTEPGRSRSLPHCVLIVKMILPEHLSEAWVTFDVMFTFNIGIESSYILLMIQH